MAGHQRRICLSSSHMGGYEQQHINNAIASDGVALLDPNVDAYSTHMRKELAEYVGAMSCFIRA